MLICVLSGLVLNSSKTLTSLPIAYAYFKKIIHFFKFFFVILIEYLISVFSFEIVAEENIVKNKHHILSSKVSSSSNGNRTCNEKRKQIS